MLIKSLIASLIIIYASFLLAKNKNFQELSNIKVSPLKILLPILLGLLLVLYLIPVSYYFPFNNGVLGDNYIHLFKMLNNPGFIKHHHPLFPLLPDIFIRLLLKVNFLSVNDPLYLEKVYYWSVLPVSLGISIGIVFFSTVLFHKGLSAFQLILVITFLFTTFGLWLWGVQSNAIGLALATELITVGVFVIWYRTQKLLWVGLLALIVSLSVFMHNGLIYLALGSFLSLIFTLAINKKSHLFSKLSQLALFLFITLVMGIFYYLIQAKLNNTYNLGDLFAILSDSEYFGSFGSHINISDAVEQNFWAGINWIIGFFYTEKNNYWSPVSTSIVLSWEVIWIKIIQMGSIISLTLIIMYFLIRKKIYPTRDLAIFGLITSIIFLLGFTLRQSGTHYYVLAMIPNIVLLVSFVISENNSKISNLVYVLPLALIIFGNIYLIAFTKLSIFEGGNLNDHPYYAESNEILNFSNKNEIHYLRKLDFSYYPNMALSMYFQDKFKHIVWEGDWNTKAELVAKINTLLSNHKKIILSDQAFIMLGAQKEWEFKKVNESMYFLKTSNN